MQKKNSATAKSAKVQVPKSPRGKKQSVASRKSGSPKKSKRKTPATKRKPKAQAGSKKKAAGATARASAVRASRLRKQLQPTRGQIKALVVKALALHVGIPKASLLEYHHLRRDLHLSSPQQGALARVLTPIAQQFPGGKRITVPEMRAIRTVWEMIDLVHRKALGESGTDIMDFPRAPSPSFRFGRGAPFPAFKIGGGARRGSAKKPSGPERKPGTSASGAKKAAKKATKHPPRKPAKKTAPKAPSTREAPPKSKPVKAHKPHPPRFKGSPPPPYRPGGSPPSLVLGGGPDLGMDDEFEIHHASIEIAPSDDDLLESAKSLPAPVGEEESAARFVQAEVYEGKRPEGKVPIPEAFVAGSKHGIDIFIGPIEEDKDTLRDESTVFPDNHLPQDLSVYVLQIDFVPSGHVEAPQQKKLIVPREGRSDFCHFDFMVPAAARRYEARIMVSFEKKVLQTMMLQGSCRTPGQPAAANASKVTLESEFVIRHGFVPLEESVKFGGSIVTDSSISVLSGVGVNLHEGSGYADIAERIDRYLSLYARSEQTKPASMNGATIEFLRDIAIEGQMLFQHLTDEGVTNAFPDPMDAIQVLSLVDGSRLPLEFVYECSESPNLNARLCESWESCIHARKCRMPDSKEHFCPSRFWGLSRVIERHAYDRVPREELKSEFRLQPEPTQNRRSLILMRRALIAGSQRVDQHLTPSSGMQALKSVAAELTDNQAALVDTWDDWRAGVTTLPDSLILIVHTDPAKPGSDVRKLEIGKDDTLHTGQLGAKEVGGSATHHPLALLLGCHTGSSTVPFEKLTTQFRRGKAAIVIGAGSLIHVKHAVPFVALFLQHLHGVLNASPSISFGEFMRRLRVECMSQGMLVCLALTAYGDADWLLARNSSP